MPTLPTLPVVFVPAFSIFGAHADRRAGAGAGANNGKYPCTGTKLLYAKFFFFRLPLVLSNRSMKRDSAIQTTNSESDCAIPQGTASHADRFPLIDCPPVWFLGSRKSACDSGRLTHAHAIEMLPLFD